MWTTISICSTFGLVFLYIAYRALRLGFENAERIAALERKLADLRESSAMSAVFTMATLGLGLGALMKPRKSKQPEETVH